MLELFSSESMTALFQVVMIDLVLAGDNAIVIGLAAAGLPEGQRKKAILIGIFAATILRIGFASVTVQLLQIIGLLLAGGVLLLWVCWKMWRELHASHHQPKMQSLRRASTIDASAGSQQKTLGQAVWQITIADVSMSLDNVLRCRRRGARASDDSDIRLGTLHRTYGVRRQLYRPPAGKAPLGGLRRPSDHPLCSCRHVLPRRAGGLATPQRVAFARRQRLSSALIGIGESAPIRDR